MVSVGLITTKFAWTVMRNDGWDSGLGSAKTHIPIR